MGCQLYECKYNDNELCMLSRCDNEKCSCASTEEAPMLRFMLDGCDISFAAKAPADMTLAQLLKQCDRIHPDYCACGIRSTDEEPEFVNMGLGNQYWYFTKHGCSPGAVPRGLDILKIVSTPEGVYPEGDYFLTDDQVITTEALRKYEIKEKAPDFDYE